MQNNNNRIKNLLNSPLYVNSDICFVWATHSHNSLSSLRIEWQFNCYWLTYERHDTVVYEISKSSFLQSLSLPLSLSLIQFCIIEMTRKQGNLINKSIYTMLHVILLHILWMIQIAWVRRRPHRHHHSFENKWELQNSTTAQRNK